MRPIRPLRPAALAGGCALSLIVTSTLAAQEATQDPAPEGKKPAADAQGAKRSPGTPSAKATEGEKKQRGVQKQRKQQARQQTADLSAHQALTRANLAALNEAQALKDHAGAENAQLSKSMVTRHAKAIGQNLDAARQHLTTLETSAATRDEEIRDRVKSVREKYESASEHHRALLQASGEAQLDPDEIEEEADGIAKDLQDAEVEHRKMPGAATMQAPPNTGTGDTTPTGRPYDGRTK